MTNSDFHDPRLTEQRNPRTERIDVASSLEIADLMNAEDATVAGAGRGQRERIAGVIVPMVGPEALTGSTRLKAGTATKLVLNTISTGAMIRLGKVYGNMMVDLMALSKKLKDRGERIVMECGGVDRATARAAIEQAGGSVKLAIVMAKKGI